MFGSAGQHFPPVVEPFAQRFRKPEHLRDAHWKGYDRSLASGDTQYAGRVMTTRAVHKDGRKLYVELSFSMLKDAEGRVIGALAVGRDGTERFLAARTAPS